MSTIQPKQTAFRASTWFQLLIVVPVLLVSLYVAVSPPNRLLNWYNNDDGFYYFVVARNIAGGAGVTFDGVNPVNGFHPLWMMICIPIFAVFNSDPLLPLRVIVLVFGVFQAAAMLLLFDLLSKKLPLLLSCLLTLLFGLASSLYSAILSGGLESGLSFFMILLLIWLAQKSRAGRRDLLWLAITGLAAGLTVLSRLDSIFTVAFLGLWCIFDRTEDSVQILADIIAACFIVMLSAGIRLGFNLLYFDRTVLSLIILWAALGALGGFLNGLYSYNPFPIKTRPILRTLLIHAALTAVIAAVSWLLAKTGLLETWSRAVLVYSSAGWLLYTLAKQFLLRNRRSLSDTPARMPIASAFWHWVKKPLAWYLPVAVLLGGYMAWSQAKFGTPTPVSGQIKVWWGSLGITVYGSPIHSFQELFQFLFGKGSPFFYLYEALNPVFAGLKTAPVRAGMFSWGLLVLAFLVLLFAGQKNRLAGWFKDLAVLPLAAGILLRLIYFFVTGYVHFRKWYWGTETLFIFFLFAAGIGSLWLIFAENRSFRHAILAAVSVLVLFSSGAFLLDTFNRYSWADDQQTPHEYFAVTQALEANTEPGAVIGIPGGGSVSYFIHDRTVVNLDGLMNSKEYFDLLQHFDTHRFMQEMGIRYVYSNEIVVLGSLPLYTIFDDRLSPLMTINDKYLYTYQ